MFGNTIIYRSLFYRICLCEILMFFYNVIYFKSISCGNNEFILIYKYYSNIYLHLSNIKFNYVDYILLY